jgi:thioredoxin reductase (NADPH)
MTAMQRNINSATHHDTDVVIIGAGPVGLFAVFELGMLGIRCHVIDTLPQVGGQCVALYPEKPIYDIPGFPSIDAGDLITNLVKQAAPFSPTYHLGEQVIQLTRNTSSHRADRLDAPASEGESRSEREQRDALPASIASDANNFNLTTNKHTTLTCKAVIIAAGCGAFGPNRPPLAGLEPYEGSHVHYMVGNKEQFRGETLVIAGGGDSAVDWANALAPLAKKIYMVHRRENFRAAPESVAQMRAKENIEMVIPYQLSALKGDGTRLQGVEVATLDGTPRTLEAQHLLAFFGLAMELGPIAQWGLNLDRTHITIDPGTCTTSEAGIYAIGDIATHPHKLKLILSGFAEAASAAHAIRKQLFPNTAYHFEYSTSKGVPQSA